MKIEFLDVFIHCGLDTVQKTGKYLCPFCGKYALVTYPDANCHCHNCKFSGNVFRFYSNVKNISYDDAVAELEAAYHRNKIKLHILSYEEKLKEFKEDLHYLAMVRMYFEFHKNSRENKDYYIKISGIHEKIFRRVLNADIESVSKHNWHMVLVFLRSKINLAKFKADLAEGLKLFHDEAYELLKSQSHKY